MRPPAAEHPDEEALLSCLISASGHGEERAAIERHLLDCDRCVSVLAVARARLALAGKVAVPVPPELVEAAERLARAATAQERSARPAAALSLLERSRGRATAIRERLEAWSRLPVLIPASFAIGVLIMVTADRILMQPAVVDSARRSVQLGPPQLVARSKAVVRTQPDANAAIIATLAPGDVVAVDHEEREWYRARLPDGREGWIERRSFE